MFIPSKSTWSPVMSARPGSGTRARSTGGTEAACALMSGSLKLKEPGEVHRDLRIHAPFTLQGAGFAPELVAAAADAMGLRGALHFKAAGFAPGERAAQLAIAMHDALVREGATDLCTQKNIAYLPFFPLAVGNVAQNKPVLAAIADKHGASPAQIALAWLLARSPVMLPIPGTSSVEHLEQNWDARRIALSADEVVTIARQG
jgi:hypothetical protein